MILSDVIIATLVIGALYAFWLHGNVSQKAYLSAKRHTEKQGVTLLDQSVVLKSMSIRRSPHSLFALERRYRFEFSSVGDVRYTGQVVFHGSRRQLIQLSPFKTPEQNEPLE